MSGMRFAQVLPRAKSHQDYFSYLFLDRFAVDVCIFSKFMGNPPRIIKQPFGVDLINTLVARNLHGEEPTG